MKTLAAFALLALPLTAHADLNLATLDAEPNRIHVTTGAEYGFVAGAGYSRIVPVLGRSIVLTGDATLPWADFDLADYRLRARALVPIAGTQRWKLAGSVAPILRGSKNKAGSLTDAGIDVGLLGGFYSRRLFAALEVGFDAALATHVSHSDSYRMHVHADAVDGWYSTPGGNLRAGLQAGVTVARYDVILRVGQVRDVGGGPPLLPFYGTLGLNARW